MKTNTIYLLLSFILTCFVFTAYGQTLTPSQIEALDKQASEAATMSVQNGQIEYKSVFTNTDSVRITEIEPVTIDVNTRNSAESSTLKPADISLFKNISTEGANQKVQQASSPIVAPEPPKDPKFDLAPVETEKKSAKNPSQVSEQQPKGDTPKSVINFRNIKGSDVQQGATKPKPE